MKIIHITASYKPAYIYGGPIQSVGKLCEMLEAKDQRLKTKEHESETKDQRAKIKEQSLKTKDQRLRNEEHVLVNKNQRPNSEDSIQVFTTTANGKSELNVEEGKAVLVDGVSVTYYNRWTKDHSHFSPGLLFGLRNMLRHLDELNAGLAQHDNNEIIIHIHAWWNLVSVLSCLVAKWYNIPVVLSPRGMLTSYSQQNRNAPAKRLIHKIIGKRLLKYCHIHATSEQEKEDVLTIIQPKSITVISNLVKFDYSVASIEKQEARSNNHKNSFRLIVLSRIEEKKGLELLFDALAMIEIPWQLTIAGSGEKNYVESLKTKAEKLNLSNRIEWIGQVNDKDKFQLMAKHDLLVLPSYNENFANVVIESLSVGTPVLVSSQVGLSDYVAEKDFGWVCTVDVGAIRNKLMEAHQEFTKREKIRSAAPISIREDFDDEVLVGRYVEMYEDVIRF